MKIKVYSSDYYRLARRHPLVWVEHTASPQGRRKGGKKQFYAEITTGGSPKQVYEKVQQLRQQGYLKVEMVDEQEWLAYS
jgi:hypothetical protein